MTTAYFDSLAARLTAIAARKLGTVITFAEWREDNRTGAQIPVFNVPQSHVRQARELGLTVAA